MLPFADRDREPPSDFVADRAELLDALRECVEALAACDGRRVGLALARAAAVGVVPKEKP